MRVLSPHPGFSIQVFEPLERQEVDRAGRGYTITVTAPLVADFAAGGGLRPEEVAFALQEWDGYWRALPEEGAPPQARISVYDTEAEAIKLGWSEEYREEVDARLRVLQNTTGSFMRVFEDIPAARPFKLYDEKNPEEILAFLVWSGGDPSEYIRYEEENLARPELLSAFKNRLEEAEDSEVIASVTA